MSAANLYLFNTASRKKELFSSIEPGKVRLYTCGPTVYHYAHIGNLRCYVFEDLLVRTLNRAGYAVNHVMNITDVGHLVTDGDEGEDKMEKGAAREGKTAWEVAEFYAKAFFRDVAALKCLAPQVIPKATEHIPEMIAMIAKLEAKGFTYRTSDGIYFDTSRFDRYAAFARIDTANLDAGARVSMGEKHHPTDFALWKFSPSDQKRQMEWESPWGRGFPGWHIECSAMSMKYLGETLDIHCGGKDHIPIHHTNEIAQSECTTDHVFSRFWMHCDFLNDQTAKMSKSSGQFLTLTVLEKAGFRPADYRYLLMQSHYRTEINFSLEILSGAQAGLEGILNRMTEWGMDAQPEFQKPSALSEAATRYQNEFNEAVFDDLNTSIALTVMFESMRDKALSGAEKRALLNSFDEVLGVGFEAEYKARRRQELPAEILALARQRDEARARKDWAGSDRFRNTILEAGYLVEDSPAGTRVTRKAGKN